MIHRSAVSTFHNPGFPRHRSLSLSPFRPFLLCRCQILSSISSLVRPVASDEAHFWWNGYVNKQNYRIWSEANPQVYVETPLHPEKLTVWCALWAGGILLQKR
ncbi:hypothetical protein TNCV_2256841 [Trichonephila clavipes]|nr:hypothetical protein TNCV_2256841 [Trichonephila clavipes]